MTWEQSVGALFEDLEQQAEGLALAERESEVDELSLAEYAQISFAARAHASPGAEVRLQLLGGLRVGGRLARAGESWLLVVDGGHEWLVPRRAVLTAGGLSRRADDESTWPVIDRLSLRALLRRLAAESEDCLLHFVDGSALRGRIGRIGKDFVELATAAPAGEVVLVPVENVTAFQARR